MGTEMREKNYKSCLYYIDGLNRISTFIQSNKGMQEGFVFEHNILTRQSWR